MMVLVVSGGVVPSWPLASRGMEFSPSTLTSSTGVSCKPRRPSVWLVAAICSTPRQAATLSVPANQTGPLVSTRLPFRAAAVLEPCFDTGSGTTPVPSALLYSSYSFVSRPGECDQVSLNRDMVQVYTLRFPKMRSPKIGHGILPSLL